MFISTLVNKLHAFLGWKCSAPCSQKLAFQYYTVQYSMEIHTSITYHIQWCKSHLTWPFFFEVTFTPPCRRNIHSAHVDYLQLILYYYSQCTCGLPTADSILLFTVHIWTDYSWFHIIIHSSHVDQLQLIPYYYSQCTCGPPTVDSILLFTVHMWTTYSWFHIIIHSAHMDHL